MPRRLAVNCSVNNCPNAASKRGRCETHQVRLPPRQARGYDAQHDKLRAHWQQRMDRGEIVICWRCATEGRPHAVDPTNWDLGHERGMHRGPECVSGNRGAPRRGG